jgi:membrane fusion protein, multidrug efflux system
MELNAETSLRKTPLWRRVFNLSLFAVVVFAVYSYRATLASWVSRRLVSAATSSDNARSAANGNEAGASGNRGVRNPSIVVSAIAAKKTDMPTYLRGLGSATPYAAVVVRSRVDGQLIKTTFQEGQVVHEGELLAEIDRRPFDVQLSQAQAQLAQAKGQLAKDDASLESAKREDARNRALLADGIITQQQFDTQASTVDQFKGAIQTDLASIDVANAAIANANLQITYTRITAPITGRIGLRLVDPGNIIRATDANGLATITQVQPIAVLFNIPEDDLGPVLKKLRAGQVLTADAYDRDDQTKLAAGRLLTVDNQIDQSTGTSRLKAVFDNANNALYPNQFVNVHLLLDVLRDATVIPAAAVQRGPQGTYVYVVDDENVAHLRYVTIRDTEGNDVAVGPELRPGERVIVEGTDKVQDNVTVEVQKVAPSGTAPKATPGDQDQ